MESSPLLGFGNIITRILTKQYLTITHKAQAGDKKTILKQVREDKIYENFDVSGKTVNDTHFSCCKFTDCKFKDTVFANSTFNECIFVNCSFVNAVFKNSAMKYCSFEKCALIGLNWSTVSTEYASVFEKIENCLLKFNNFDNVSLKKVNFGKSQIISSTFYQINASECSFTGCDLKDTSFSGCDLQKSDFRSASGFSIDVTSCKLKGAKFSFTNLDRLVRGLGIKID